MHKPLKAALFSLLIFPGAGQLLLKKYLSALFFATFAVIGLYLLMSDLFSRVNEILAQVQSGEVVADLATITELVQQQSATSTSSLSPALSILLITWLVSSVEAYRVGRKLALENQSEK